MYIYLCTQIYLIIFLWWLLNTNICSGRRSLLFIIFCGGRTNLKLHRKLSIMHLFCWDVALPQKKYYKRMACREHVMMVILCVGSAQFFYGDEYIVDLYVTVTFTWFNRPNCILLWVMFKCAIRFLFLAAQLAMQCWSYRNTWHRWNVLCTHAGIVEYSFNFFKIIFELIAID